MTRIVFVLASLISIIVLAAPDREIQNLAKEVFAWRAVTQPATPNDILRVERPDGWVPDYSKTAVWEARFFASTPGQAISYQIGKLQILALVTDAQIHLGDKFILRDYHDYMMENGNVPIALQRWEYLGLQDELEKLWPGAR